MMRSFGHPSRFRNLYSVLYFLLAVVVAPGESGIAFQADGFAERNPAAQREKGDWLQWRGPTGNGIADTGQNPPVSWSETIGIIWKTRIPGRGHSSPILVGNKVFLTTAMASNQTQAVLALDRNSGKLLWQKTIHQGKWESRIHPKNTHASPTIASDGNCLLVGFHSDRSVFLSRLDLDGELVWQKRLGPFEPKYPYGYAASPIIHGEVVFVAVENEKEGFLGAYDIATGKMLWNIARRSTNYSTPVVARVQGRNQLLLSGSSQVAAFDTVDGHTLWTAPARWQVSCGTLVWSEDMVFASGGYPRGQTLGVRADGSGRIVWENPVKCYEQSMLYFDGYVYAISDTGIGYCWRASDGKEMWKARLEGPVSSSPVLAAGNIYYSSERGTTCVFRANPTRFQLIARNRLGDSAFASPAIVDGRIYLRIGKQENGTRQEFLYCVGAPVNSRNRSQPSR